jgi:glycosyltransferase involved in cell wall biosynthesis
MEELKKIVDELQKKIDILLAPKIERTDYPSITVCIPTYNSVHTIYWCLWALRNQTINPKILVFDNGSIDGTPEALEAAIRNKVFKELDIEFRRLGRISGEGREKNIPFIRNKLVQAVQTDYAFSLDSDVILPPNTLPSLIELMEKKPLLAELTIVHDAVNNKHDTTSATLFRAEVFKKIKWVWDKDGCDCVHAKNQILAMGYETGKMSTLLARHLLAV